MLRNTASSISRELSKIFKMSLNQQKVPSAWKTSNINPIPKSKDIDKCSSYRPISLLSLPSKILEKIVHNHVSNFLAEHSLLCNIQFGFRPRSSTQEALLSVTNTWHNMLTKHTQIASVFLDVRKAFDSVPHNRLIKALHFIGIQGPLLNWFRDYLTSRHQQVVLDGKTSHTVPVTSGVPQGSILGPLMFNIFMNSISNVPLSKNCHIILYADDILLFKPIDNNNDLSDFQQDLTGITDWIHKQGLTPNHQKTLYLPISRSKIRTAPVIHLNGHPLSPCLSVKYLGVTLTSNLSWSQHIDTISKATKRLLGRVHRNFRDAPNHLRHRIYTSTILPKLDYCSAVWDPHHQTHSKRLENVQKFAGRVITQKWSAEYESLLSSLNLKPLATRRRMQKLNYATK